MLCTTGVESDVSVSGQDYFRASEGTGCPPAVGTATQERKRTRKPLLSVLI